MQQPVSLLCNSLSKHKYNEDSQSSLKTVGSCLPFPLMGDTISLQLSVSSGTQLSVHPADAPCWLSVLLPLAGTAQHFLCSSRWGFLGHLTLQYQSDPSHVARLPFLSYNQ